MMLNGCKLMKEHEAEMGIHSEGPVGRVWGERVAISSWMVKERLREGDAARKGCRESKSQNAGQVQDFKTWSGWCRLGGGTAQRSGLWLSGQEAGGEVGETAMGWPATSELLLLTENLCCIFTACFFTGLSPPWPVHPGGKAPSPRPGVEGECSIDDNCAHFFLFVFFFFQF